MKRPMCRWTRFAAFCIVVITCSPLLAQQPAARGPFRKLAPGVLQEIDPLRTLEETCSRHDVVEILAADPSFEWAKDEAFRQDIWTLEFKFKPVRMLWIDIPQPNGFMKKKLIWYMVYSVSNKKIAEKAVAPNDPGPLPQYGWMQPTDPADGMLQIRFANRPIRFIPQFILEAPEVNKVYSDRVIPVAVKPIRDREDRNRTFHTTADMVGEIPVGQTRWGVVTWEGIDPRIDRFSIFVRGLTNAYRWQDKPGAFKKGDRIGTGRRLSRKTLKLNFWRPGDEFYENEKDIRYGIPGEPPGEVDYTWVYR